MDQERADYGDPESPGQQVLMNAGWRPPATAAIVCVILVPLLAVLGAGIWDADQKYGAWPIIFPCGITFAVGFGCAIAGVRRGSWASRAASAICLVVLALPVFGATIIGVLLAVYGMPRLG
jgi:hypothetical protein